MVKAYIEDFESKNPLSVFLGIFMRIERNNRGETVRSISRKFGLGDSYYRMIESGNANLHPSKSFLFFSIFGGTYIMNLGKVCKYLSGIQAIETETQKALGFEQKLSFLKRYEDMDFNLFFQDFNLNFEDKIEFENYIHRKISVFFNDYLELSHKERQQHFLNTKLNNLPSVYFDVVSNTIDELLFLPVILGNKSVWQWEVRNVEFLREQICITNSPESICSIENLSKYKYWHLWSSKFIKINMIVATDSKSKEWIEREFKKNLEISLRQDNEFEKIKSLDDAVSKLEFKVLSKDNNKYLLKEFLEFRMEKPNYIPYKYNNFSFDAVWIWTLKKNERTPEYNVGFMADIIYEDSDKNKNLAETILSLNFEKVMEYTDKLNDLWQKI